MPRDHPQARANSTKCLRREMQYWLLKSEPEVYSISDLRHDKQAIWEGVRNYQARNFLRSMRIGDRALFYHSNCKPPGVVGSMRLCREAYPDPTQFDPNSPYFDAKSSEANPRWSAVDFSFEDQWTLVPLAQLRDDPVLASMRVAQRGSRLSVTPVEETHFRRVMFLARAMP